MGAHISDQITYRLLTILYVPRNSSNTSAFSVLIRFIINGLRIVTMALRSRSLPVETGYCSAGADIGKLPVCRTIFAEVLGSATCTRETAVNRALRDTTPESEKA